MQNYKIDDLKINDFFVSNVGGTKKAQWDARIKIIEIVGDKIKFQRIHNFWNGETFNLTLDQLNKSYWILVDENYARESYENLTVELKNGKIISWPKNNFARHEPVAIGNIAHRIIELRSILADNCTELPPEIVLKLKRLCDPIPFEKELISPKLEIRNHGIKKLVENYSKNDVDKAKFPDNLMERQEKVTQELVELGQMYNFYN